ncbi:unnamed protein product, partial [Urochloa humidicola]
GEGRAASAAGCGGRRRRQGSCTAAAVARRGSTRTCGCRAGVVGIAVSEIRSPNQKTWTWLGSYSTAEAAAPAFDAALRPQLPRAPPLPHPRRCNVASSPETGNTGQYYEMAHEHDDIDM